MKTKKLDSLELFKKLLSFKSITPNDDGAMDFIEEYLCEYECIKIDEGGVKNRFFYKDFSNGKSGKHLCFGGHIDVVPPGENWQSDPFVPTIKDDTITARGTQDMKSGINAFLQVLKDTKEFDGTLSLLITSDEEGDATHGTVIVLKHLKKINLLPSCAIIAEPTCEKIFGDTLKIGRRGSINGILTIKGKQGHAAYPQKADNPIHKIANVLDKIAGINLDDGDDDFAPSQVILTDIRGGMQVCNVTANEVVVMFNVRNSTKTNQEKIKEVFHNVFKDINYNLTLSQSAYPFVTDTSSDIVKTTSQAIKKYLKIDTDLSTAGGTSDARFFGQYKIPTVEFGVKNDKIHAINESTSIKDVLMLEEIFKEVAKTI